MRTKFNRRPLYAGLGLAGLVLLGLVVGIYRSGGQRLSSLNRALRERKDTLARLESRVATLKKLESRCAKLGTRLAVLEPALPTGEYVPTFLRQIEKLAQDTSNSLSSIKPKPVVMLAVAKPKQNFDEDAVTAGSGNQKGKAASKTGSYETLTIEMGIEGEYWDLMLFLEQLGRFPKMIAVNEMSLSGTQQAGRSLTPDMTVTSRIDLVALIQNREPKQWKNGEKS